MPGGCSGAAAGPGMPRPPPPSAEERPCPAERVSPCRLPRIGASLKRQQQAVGWGEAEPSCSDPAEPLRRVCKPGELGRCDCCMRVWPALGVGGHGDRWVNGTPVAHGGIGPEGLAAFGGSRSRGMPWVSGWLPEASWRSCVWI